MNKKEMKPEKKRPKLVGTTVEITVDQLSDDGAGVAFLEGKKLFCRGILPGERAIIRVVHQGKTNLVGELVKITKTAPARIKPPCPHAAHCDACPLIALTYDAQLTWKRELLSYAVSRYASIRHLEIPPVLAPAKCLNYRNSAKLVVSGKFSSPRIGIYKTGSHDPIDISGCPLHHPLINRIVEVVKDGIRRQKVPIYSPRTSSGILRYLAVRVSETENRAIVVFVTAYRSYNEIHHLAKFLKETVPEVSVIVQNVNPSEGNVVFGQKDFILTPAKNITDKIGETRFSISPRSFFQVNNSGAEILYSTVRQWANLTGNERVLDIYCGVGGISLYLAPHAESVTGIEILEPAVLDAEINARLNGIGNCEFIAGDATEIMAEMRENHEKIDLVIFNPPRKGCDERVLKDAALLAPETMAYVSCYPPSLCRDLDILSRLGYRTCNIQPVDMFPQTPHVETIALLRKER